MGSDVHTEPKRNRMVSRMLSKVLRGADRVTSVSHALRLQAEAIAEPPREIEVIYNGCDTKAFTFNPVGRRRIRGELRISTGEVAIIYVGSLLRTKGVYEMLQALQLSNQSGRSIRLIVVGAGKEKGKLERFAAASGVSDRISFLGQVPHAHIVHLLSASDILALPSYNEGLPNIVLEAMACGLPVIATDVGGIPEAVEDGRSGILIPPREVAPLVQAVDCLVLDPERRRRMGLRGRAIVESKFKWENTAAGFKEVYRSLLIE